MMNNTIQNRYEIMALVQAVMCNPNGDPDAGNAPRNDPFTGQGIITDVAFKRWIRNYIQDAYNQEIMISKGASLNTKIAAAVLEANDIKVFPKTFKNERVDESAALMCKKYWDVRTFGGVMSTGRNAGQIKGAVQIAMATSYDPIDILDMQITRMAYADGKDCKTLEEYEEEERTHENDKKRTFGEKHIACYGLFQFKASVSAAIAKKVGFTEEDLKMLFEAIFQMMEHNNSSSKMGMSLVSPVIVFKHVGTQDAANAEQKIREAILGCAPAHKLFELLHVQKRAEIESPRKIEDYEIAFDYQSVPKGVEVGLKLEPYGDVCFDQDVIKEWADSLGKNSTLLG